VSSDQPTAPGSSDGTHPDEVALQRERVRRATRIELANAGLALIRERGYDAVTVEQIANAAGMSKRSFFRYFASKEELVTGRTEQLGDDVVVAFRARPLTEPLWESLRRAFDVVTAQTPDAALDAIVAGSPTLRAAAREQHDRTHDLLVEAMAARAFDRGLEVDAADVAPHAVVGAALACLRSAQRVATDEPGDLADALDEAMELVGPTRH
jgi:AcrR family transcriptional regulator